jgi:hypothetical protein
MTFTPVRGHSRDDQASEARQRLLGVAAFVEIGDQHKVRLAGALDAVGAIGDSLVDVSAAAKLDSEQHFDRIGQLPRQVEDDGVEADELRPNRRQRCHHRREDGGIDHRARHRAGLVDGIDMVKLIAAREVVTSGLPGAPVHGMTADTGLPLGFAQRGHA